jgi:hypothetical protein
MKPCECGQPRAPKSDSCDECKRITSEWYTAQRGGVRAAVHALLLRHYPDWLEGVEIRATVNSRESSSALWALEQDGKVEARRFKGCGYTWRIKRAA